MEKTMKTILALMAGALTFSACSSEESVLNENGNNNNGAKLVTLTAYQESDDVTSRAAIDGTTATQIDWTTGDEINYFGAGSGEKMTLSSGEGTNEGKFSGTVTQGTTDYVLYPYQSTATISEGVITAEIPSNQTATVGSFDPKAALMTGVVNNGSVEFKNVCSFLKIVTNKAYNKVEVSVTSGDIAGNFTITPSTGKANVLENMGKKTITLAPTSGTMAAGTYYVAIAPCTNATGLKIKCYVDETNYIGKAKSGNSTFSRKDVFAMGGPGTWTKGIASVSTTAGVTDNEVEWVQLWENGPKWATINIGQTVKDYSTITIYDITTVGGLYTWGKTDDSRFGEYKTSDNYKTGEDDLSGDDDTATKLWGSAWRMPTHEELISLADNAGANVGFYEKNPATGYTLNLVWTAYNSSEYLSCPFGCFKISGKAGTTYESNFIILQSAGYHTNSSSGPERRASSFGANYWSSTHSSTDKAGKLIVDWDGGASAENQVADRKYGYSVRAVIKE